MERRKFLQSSSLVALGASLLSPLNLGATSKQQPKLAKGKYKNVIFMVSDGMSNGTLSMANLLHRSIYGTSSNWIKLYEDGKAQKALMDTSSASSIVTDSAAASSAWGGGKKVSNGSLNYNSDTKTTNKPILQKMKEAGKAIGCVTTVPITHATPAGFCIATASRNEQAAIAEMYLELQPDVMLGGGGQYFASNKRKDGKDMYQAFKNLGYHIALTKKELNDISSLINKKLIGTFAEDALPYSIDQFNDAALNDSTPSLSEMTQIALQRLSTNKNGFMLQIEAGKVDWAAHANDISALLFDQLEFDKTIAITRKFVEEHPDTLLIITTDHGNANPGVFYGKNATENFEKIKNFKHSTDWVLNKISKNMNTEEVNQLFLEAFHIALSEAEVSTILSYYANLSEGGVYNYKKLPYKYTAEVLANYTSIKFADMDHSGDHVELAFVGKPNTTFPSFIANDQLHHLILDLT